MAVDEWDQRQLCPDDACTGVIGSAGTCKVCGRVAPNWGDERTRGLRDPVAEDDEADEDDDDDDLDDEDGDDDLDEDEGDTDGVIHAAGSSTGLAIGGASWGDRQLCPDGSCIGVIGDDGRCKVCGRAGEAPAAQPLIVVTDPVVTEPVSTGDVVVEAPATTEGETPATEEDPDAKA